MPAVFLLAMLLAAPEPEAPGLSVKPGEAIVFRLEGERPVQLRPGEAPEAGELGVTLSSDEGMTMLHVTNNTSRWLHYRATMTLPNGRIVATIVCTLSADRRGEYAFWPERLSAITLYAFRPAPEGETVCAR